MQETETATTPAGAGTDEVNPPTSDGATDTGQPPAADAGAAPEQPNAEELQAKLNELNAQMQQANLQVQQMTRDFAAETDRRVQRAMDDLERGFKNL